MECRQDSLLIGMRMSAFTGWACWRGFKSVILEVSQIPVRTLYAGYAVSGVVYLGEYNSGDRHLTTAHSDGRH